MSSLPYHSPHKFRHGHIHYGLENSKDIKDYKAVSLNVLHSSMKITDEFYSIFNDSDLQNRINSLSKTSNINNNIEMVSLLENFIEMIKRE